MLDKVASKPVDKDKEGDQKNKNNEDTKWSKGIKKHKDLQVFLEITPMQKEVLSSHKLHHHAYE